MSIVKGNPPMSSIRKHPGEVLSPLGHGEESPGKFFNRIVDGTAFTCPTCASRTKIGSKIIQMTFLRNKERFKEAGPFKSDWDADYADFDCVGCDCAFRVLFSTDEFRMSCYYYTATGVLYEAGAL